MNTERIYDAVWDWLIVFGPKILIAIIALLIGEWLIKIIRSRLKRRLESKKSPRGIMPFLQGIIITALHVLLFLLIMQIIGIRLTIFAALIAAFGAAAGFALSGTLQNFASGVIILMLKPFRIGDRIFAQGQEGTIASIQLFYTYMYTYDNRTIVFPNSKVSNEVIINFSVQEKRRFEMEFKLPYQVEIQKAKDVILNAIVNDKDIIQDPSVEVAVVGLDPDGYRVQIHAWLSNKGFQSKRYLLNEVILSALFKSGLKTS